MRTLEKQRKLIYVLSAAAFCILLVRPLLASLLIAPAVTILLFSSLPVGRQLAEGGKTGRKSRGRFIWALLISLFFTALFLTVWLRTKQLVSLHFFRWKEALPVLLAAVVGGFGAIPFLTALLEHLYKSDGAAESVTVTPILPGEKTRASREDRRLLFCVALVSVSVCSLSSPLYPFNDWVDANCFFTVGKSMLYGIVPYRDLYEQKGPLLYALYALCYPISHRTFLGGWLLEVGAAWAFLSLAWKSQLLLTGKREPIFLFLTAALVYTVPAFLKGGSAEELSLPLLMLSFYYGLCCICLNRELTGREAFLVGLSSGAVLWIKYSMLGFYLGFILVPAYRMLRKGRALRLIQLLGLIVLGVATASVPVMAYFGYHRALSSLWEAYFYNNLFVYGKSSSLINTFRGLASGLASMLTFNDATVLLVLVSVITLWREKNKALAIHVFLCFGFAFGLIYAGGINLKYYSEILCVFIPLGVIQLLKLCHNSLVMNRNGDGKIIEADCPGKEKKRLPEKQNSLFGRTSRILIPILFTLALFGSENSYMLFHKRSEMPQYIFAETLKEDPDASLFNYGALDIGLFTTADILPSTRYFCMLNLPSEEMVTEMEHYMRDGATKYIVSRGLEVESPCYRLMQTAEFMDNGTLYPYYLYIRSTENSGEAASEQKLPSSSEIGVTQ